MYSAVIKEIEEKLNEKADIILFSIFNLQLDTENFTVKNETED